MSETRDPVRRSPSVESRSRSFSPWAASSRGRRSGGSRRGAAEVATAAGRGEAQFGGVGQENADGTISAQAVILGGANVLQQLFGSLRLSPSP